MAIKRLPRPRDPAQLGKLVVDILTGQVEDREEDGKNIHAVALARLGAAKGGRLRAKKLSRKRRVAIAQKAAKARWATLKNKS